MDRSSQGIYFLLQQCRGSRDGDAVNAATVLGCHITMSYDAGTAHCTPGSIASLPVPSRVSPSGSSKRKSKPVKRIVDDPLDEETTCEENREPGRSLETTIESVMQMTSDGDQKIAHLDISDQEDIESEPIKKETGGMDQLEALKRFAEMLMASQNGLQTLMNTAGCNIDPMMANSLASPILPTVTTDAIAASHGLMQNMFTMNNSMAGLFANSATSPLTPNNSLFSGFVNSNGGRTDYTSSPNTPTTNSGTVVSSLANSKGPLKRKLFDMNKELTGQPSPAISKEERIDMDDLENFAQQFKKQRIKFGFTQGDVGVALGKRYGTDFSQTTISRFEALNLSFKNMCKLRPLLKEWLADAESAIANGASLHDLLDKPTPSKPTVGNIQPIISDISPSMVSPGSLGIPLEPSVKRRRKRTNLDLAQRSTLDAYFTLNPRPDHDRMTEIANLLELDRDVVRVWFCNRRQKVRRTDDPEPGDNPLLASLKALQDGTMNLSGLAGSSSDMGNSSSLSPSPSRDNSISNEASPDGNDSPPLENGPESP